MSDEGVLLHTETVYRRTDKVETFYEADIGSDPEAPKPFLLKSTRALDALFEAREMVDAENVLRYRVGQPIVRLLGIKKLRRGLSEVIWNDYRR